MTTVHSAAQGCFPILVPRLDICASIHKRLSDPRRSSSCRHVEWRHATNTSDLIYIRAMSNQQFDRLSPQLLAALTVRDAMERIVPASILCLNIRAELQEQTQTWDIPGNRGGAD